MEAVKVNKSRTKREMNSVLEKKCTQLDETCRGRIEKLKSELVLLAQRSEATPCYVMLCLLVSLCRTPRVPVHTCSGGDQGVP